MPSMGRCVGNNRPRAGRKHGGTEQKMAGGEAVVGVRIGVPRVEHQQLVEHRGAGAPMSDDKNRIVLDLRPGDATAPEDRLQEPQDRIDSGCEGENRRHSPPQRCHVKPVSPEHGEPRGGRPCRPRPGDTTVYRRSRRVVWPLWGSSWGVTRSGGCSADGLVERWPWLLGQFVSGRGRNHDTNPRPWNNTGKKRFTVISALCTDKL